MNSAISVYARRKLKRDKFYLGSIALNRSSFSEKNTVGMFAKDFPILIETDDDDTYMQLINKVSDKSVKVLRHFNGTKPITDDAQELFDLWVSFQNATLDADPAAVITQYYSKASVDIVVFSVEDRMSEGQFNMIVDHSIKVSDKEVDELFDTVTDTLKSIISNPDQPIE